MNIRPSRASPDRTPILLGCVGALVLSLFSCCALSGLAVVPALTDSVPSPPASDPTRHDIAIVVGEAFLNRALTEALPGGGSGDATMDVQPDNRLVVTAGFDLFGTNLQVVITIRLTAEAGRVQLSVESVEAGEQDVLSLLGVDPGTLTGDVGKAIQEQIEAGLGEGAQIHGIVTDDERIVIMARWAQ